MSENRNRLYENENKSIQIRRKSIGIRRKLIENERKSRNNVGKLNRDGSDLIQFVQVLKKNSNTKEKYRNV
ncbi:hypothetical protein DF185_15505 [Marinifilum breve]|uniref:Uncharacterized protein n=1 Tax=Marinifilum breve TaxID=2184082 RepID=A0A2V4A8B2_9BACT|nr:hypothetical protein [Marinifilum breve]PXX98782.1 hypothetical protein DF185_15505 [Marinifilum breve]